MTAADVTNTLCRCHWTPQRHTLVPNVTCILPWEADLLVMYDSGWAEEVEVKISLSDFRREFNADGRNVMKWLKHQTYRGGGTPHRGMCVRRFWIAAPAQLAERILEETPAYAGVIAVTYQCTILRAAPLIHGARKLTEKEQRQVLRLGYLRYWDLRRKHAATA